MNDAQQHHLCDGRTRWGEPCRGPACAGDHRCRHHGGERRVPKTCDCGAYNHPHRPGGGRCMWPDLPQGKVYIYPPPVPAGTNRPTGRRRRGKWAKAMRHHHLHPILDRKVIDRDLITLRERDRADDGWIPLE
jgi:hypothetical protein